MPEFRVQYLQGGPHQAGQRFVVSTEVNAPDVQSIASVLDVPSHAVLSIQQIDGLQKVDSRLGMGHRLTGGGGTAKSRRPFPVRLFAQELAILMDSGIALLEALQTLREKEASGATYEVLSNLIVCLEQGQSFGQALKAQKQSFDALFTASIEASQATGQVPHALRQHAEYLGWLQNLRGKFLSALIYPAILITVGLLVMFFLITFVIPRFAQIYDEMGSELPALTGALLAVGRVINGNLSIFILLVLGVLALTVWAWHSPMVRNRAVRTLWRMPGLGERMRVIELATLYRTLGMLLKAGVPAVSAVQACVPLVSTSLRASLQAAHGHIRDGARMSDSLHGAFLTTPVSLRMIRVGERSGELGAMLLRAATFYDEEIARFSDFVGRVVSPILMLMMGLMIGTMVLLMYLPIFQVADQIR